MYRKYCHVERGEEQTQTAEETLEEICSSERVQTCFQTLKSKEKAEKYPKKSNKPCLLIHIFAATNDIAGGKTVIVTESERKI